MYSSYPYAYSYATYSMPSFYSVFLTVLAALVIVAGGLALYFLFVRKPNHYQGAAARLHDALSFRTFYTEKLLRALYCIAVVSIVVSSVILLFSNFFGALLVFIAGNLIARIVFEFALLLLVLCRNTQEINQKMGPLPGEPAAPQPPQDTVPPSQPQGAQEGSVRPQATQAPSAQQGDVPPQAPVPPQPEQNPPRQ